MTFCEEGDTHRKGTIIVRQVTNREDRKPNFVTQGEKSKYEENVPCVRTQEE